MGTGLRLRARDAKENPANIITGLTGGILMGKKIRDKKFLWGFVAGTVYFGILFAVSLIIKGGAGIEPVKMITTWVLCACAGTAGGMIS